MVSCFLFRRHSAPRITTRNPVSESENVSSGICIGSSGHIWYSPTHNSSSTVTRSSSPNSFFFPTRCMQSGVMVLYPNAAFLRAAISFSSEPSDFNYTKLRKQFTSSTQIGLLLHKKHNCFPTLPHPTPTCHHPTSSTPSIYGSF